MRGLFKYFFARISIFLGIVAENKRVWCWCMRQEKMNSTSVMNPMLSISSASSSTNVLTSERLSFVL